MENDHNHHNLNGARALNVKLEENHDVRSVKLPKF